LEIPLLETGALAALLVAIACDSGGGDQDRPSASPVTEAAVFERATALSQKLSRVREAASESAARTEASCPDDAITEALGLAAGELLAADYDYLERYQSPGASAKHVETGPWAFLTTPALREVRAPVELESKRAAVDMVSRMQAIAEHYHYVGVIRTTERRAPQMSDDRFVAGALSGHVVVVDLESGKRLCQAAFSTPTPPDVALPKGKDRDRALFDDLAMRGRQALSDAVGRITRVLTLDLG
jgi:hypothetical protein